MFNRTFDSNKFINNELSLFQKFTNSLVFNRMSKKIDAGMSKIDIDLDKEIIINLFPHLILLKAKSHS